MRAARLFLLLAFTPALPVTAQPASELSALFTSVGFTSQDSAADPPGADSFFMCGKVTKGSVLRKAVVGRTRGALERWLASIKSDIERTP